MTKIFKLSLMIRFLLVWAFISVCTKVSGQVTILPVGPVALQVGGVVLTASNGFSSYQWKKNYVDPIGTNSATLLVTKIGIYQVTATGSAGQFVSAVVRVVPPVETPGSIDKNYTLEQANFQSAIATVSDIKGAWPFSQIIRYSDGFGRTTQEISIKGSPQLRDAVSFHEYDGTGRESRNYLPYTIESEGQFRTNAIAEQQNFYTWEPKIATWSTGPAYGEAVYEDSPLNRVLEQGAPGSSWQIQRAGSGESTFQGHTNRARTRVNQLADNIPLWSSSFGYPTGSFTMAAALTLAVAETKDEDGRLTQSFTNAQGQIIGQRNVVQSANNRVNPLTSYAYDEAGRLIMVLTPEGVKRAVEDGETVNNAFFERWAYLFTYDEQGRQSGKKVPGKAWSSIVYDAWNRVVATQSGNQRTGPVTQHKWSYVKYDELNRPIITGTFLFAGTRSDLALSIENDFNAGLTGRYEIGNVSTAIVGTTIGYTLSRTFPRNPPQDQLFTVSYFDDYAFLQNNYRSLAYTQEPRSYRINSPAAASNRTVGATTANQTRILGTNQWLTAALYYDEQGRMIQSKTENHRRGIDRLTTEYDFAGKVIQTHLYHAVVDATASSPGNESHSVRYRHHYDAAGRSKALYALFDGIHGNTQEVLLSVNEYNEIGQLVDNKLGCFVQARPKTNVQARYLQSVDYRYNLRGQLEKLNNRNISGVSRTEDTWRLQGAPEWLGPHTPNEDSDAYADLFGLELAYDVDHTGNTVANFNGNITSMMWNSRSPANNKIRGYVYDYDKLNQVTAARYSAYDYNQSAGRYDWSGEKDDQMGKGRFTTDGLQFDLNGNIMSLRRVGRKFLDGQSPTPFQTIDDLSYTYEGNKLVAVADAAQATVAPNDFEDNTSQIDEYQYDANANLIKDKNKSIDIIYNELELPAQINFANGKALCFSYSATGEKLSQRYAASASPGGAVLKQTDYIAGFVYGQSDHTFVATPTGRAIYEPNRVQMDKWVQEYHLRDHLGSLRLAFRAGGIDLMARASMEPSASIEEEAKFDHLADTRSYDPDHARSGDYSALLNLNQNFIGPTTYIDVKAGDSLRIEVFARYESGAPLPKHTPVLLPTLAMGSEAAPQREGKTRASQGSLFQRLAAGLTLAWTDITHLGNRNTVAVPQAYIHYDLYDKDSLWVSSDVKLLDASAQDEWQQLALDVAPASDGYVVVSVENNSAQDVWFDDLRVESTEDMVVQENHYDPFGQNLTDIETLGSPDCPQQYTGKERIQDEGLEWTDYGARYYDAQLGGWHGPDPAGQYASPFTAMGNNPVNTIDPDGRLAWFVPVIIGAAFGAYAGYQAGQAQGATGWAMAGYITTGAVIGGASGGTASAISAAGGGAILAGAGAGAVGGAGFAGLQSGWDAGAMLEGGLTGGIAGAVGGGVGASIGGGAGAFVGGASADLVRQSGRALMHGDKINPLSALVSGALAFGMYHGMSYAEYKLHVQNNPQFNPGGHHLKYNQFAKTNAIFQKARFFHEEYAITYNSDGSSRVFNDGHWGNVSVEARAGDWGMTHTHWMNAGTPYTKTPDGLLHPYHGSATGLPGTPGNYFGTRESAVHSFSYNYVLGQNGGSVIGQGFTSDNGFNGASISNVFVRFFLFK